MPSANDATGQNTVRCSNCGTEIQERAESCPDCGTRQPNDSDASDDKSLLGATLSVPVPGLGQMVNRQFGRGLVFIVVFYGGFFVFNTILGFAGLFDLLLFGVWGYAIYDAYVKGWETDEQESARQDAAIGETDDVESNETTNESRTTTAGTSGSPSKDPAEGETDRSGPAESTTVDVATESTATAEGSTADRGSGRNTTGEGATADSTATAGGGADETATEREDIVDTTATHDDIDDIEEENVSIGNGDSDEEEENDGSKWSHDDSDRSWSD
jgi:TM2 domain-containing membrane protein YozV